MCGHGNAALRGSPLPLQPQMTHINQPKVFVANEQDVSFAVRSISLGIHDLFKCTLSSSNYVVLNDWQLETMWKEVVMVYFKELSQYFPRVLEKITKILSQDSSFQLEI